MATTTTPPQLQTVQLPPGFALLPCTPGDVPHLVDVYIRAFADGDHVYWWGPEAAMRAWNTVRFRRFFDDPDEALFKIVDREADGGDGRIVAFSRWVLPRTMRGEGGFRRGNLVDVEVEVGGRAGVEGGGGGAAVGRVVDEENEALITRNPEDGHATGGRTEDNNPTAAQEDEEEKHPDVPEGAEGVDVELYREFFGTVARAQKRYGADKLKLALLATDSAYRSRGLGAALLQHGLSAADAEGEGEGKGVDAYLDALPLAAPLYRRFGFETVERLEFPRARERRVNGGDAAREPFLYVMVRRPGGRTDG